jgi:crotonobetainyl-CoA:carnitine CoA-transferase CaiB-like acyl-CoA transferase
VETTHNGPLNGLRVLDLGTVHAAPITAMLLGDYGAEVIKVEHPRGDPARTHGWNRDGHGLWWKVIARNKQTVTLNLGKPEGQDILRRLVATADVLIENFRPGVMEAWELGPDELLAINPRLVMLRVTGFGQTGPYAKRRAFGTLAEAMSGLAHQTGQEDGPPTLPPFGLADGVAGITGALAVMLALYTATLAVAVARSSTSRCWSRCWGSWAPARACTTSSASSPDGTATARPTTPRATPTSQGRPLGRHLGQRDLGRRARHAPDRPTGHRRRAVVRLGRRAGAARRPDRSGGGRVDPRPALDEVVKAFEEAGAALAPIYTVEQLMEDRQVVAREVVTTIDDEDLGPLKMQNVMFRMGATPGRIRHGGRRLGQDNESVFSELLGVESEKLERLHEDGVI